MNIKSTVIATATAAAIALGTVAPTTTAQAAPFTPFNAVSSEQATQIEKVGGRHRQGRRHHRRHNRRHHGHAAAGVALGIGALALGAAIASANARPARECYIERVRRWSPRHHAYVIHKERVCY